MEECSHKVVFEGLCANCGIGVAKRVEYDEYGNTLVESRAAGFACRNLAIEVSQEFANNVEDEKFKSLIRTRKAILVTDLDHTLLHAVVQTMSPEHLNVEMSGGVWGKGAFDVEEKLRNDPNTKVDIPIVGPFRTKCFVHHYTGVQESNSDTSIDNAKKAKIQESGSVSHENLRDLLLSVPMDVDPKITGTIARKTLYPHYAIGSTPEEEMEIEAKLVAWEMNTHLILHSDPLGLSDHVNTGSLQPSMMYRSYTKLRPGVLTFFREIIPYYELFMYTAGTTNHTTGTLRLLDPEGLFFGSNIFTRDHMIAEKKDLKKIFPTLNPMAVVLDDSDLGVWNLEDTGFIKVWAYHYWPSPEPPINMYCEVISETTQSRLNSRFRANETALLNALVDQTIEDAAPDNYDPFSDMTGGLVTGMMPHNAGDGNAAGEKKKQSGVIKDSYMWFYDDDFQLASVYKALMKTHQNFYEEVDDVLELVDEGDLVIGDLTPIRNHVLEAVYAPLGSNTFVAPIYSESEHSTLRAVDLDYWCIQSGFYHAGLLHRILGIAIEQEDNGGFVWVGDIKNTHLLPWYIPENIEKWPLNTSFPDPILCLEWNGFGTLKRVSTDKLIREKRDMQEGKSYVAVGYTYEHAMKRMKDISCLYLHGCTPVSLEWLEARIFAFLSTPAEWFQGEQVGKPRLRHFWSSFFNYGDVNMLI